MGSLSVLSLFSLSVSPGSIEHFCAPGPGLFYDKSDFSKPIS